VSCLDFFGPHRSQISPTRVVPQFPLSLNGSHFSRIVAHIPRSPHRHIRRVFPHHRAFLALPAFPDRPITSRISRISRTSLSLLVPGAWFLIYLGGSPGQITCCPINYRVLNPPLHVIIFPLVLSTPPVPSIYIDCIR